jgi:predicted dehydrogenase
VASTPERTEEAAARSAPRTFRDGLELITSGDVDVVHICTPNDLHHPLADAALASGKHVVCEKPPRSAWLTLGRCAPRSTRPVSSPRCPRLPLLPDGARPGRARDAGRPARLIHGSYLQDWLASPDDYNWRIDPALGGPSRAFADIGSHWCDLVEFVTGDHIASVCAELITALPERLSAGDGLHAFAQRATSEGSVRSVDTEDVALVMFRTAG